MKKIFNVKDVKKSSLKIVNYLNVKTAEIIFFVKVVSKIFTRLENIRDIKSFKSIKMNMKNQTINFF